MLRSAERLYLRLGLWESSTLGLGVEVIGRLRKWNVRLQSRKLLLLLLLLELRRGLLEVRSDRLRKRWELKGRIYGLAVVECRLHRERRLAGVRPGQLEVLGRIVQW